MSTKLKPRRDVRVRSSDVVRQRLIEAIKRDIRNIGCIYRSIGDALYDEPVERLAERIASTVERKLPNVAGELRLPDGDARKETR